MIGRFEAFGWGGRHGTGAMELGDFFSVCFFWIFTYSLDFKL